MCTADARRSPPRRRSPASCRPPSPRAPEGRAELEDRLRQRGQQKSTYFRQMLKVHADAAAGGHAAVGPEPHHVQEAQVRETVVDEGAKIDELQLPDVREPQSAHMNSSATRRYAANAPLPCARRLRRRTAASGSGNSMPQPNTSSITAIRTTSLVRRIHNERANQCQSRTIFEIRKGEATGQIREVFAGPLEDHQSLRPATNLSRHRRRIRTILRLPWMDSVVPLKGGRFSAFFFLPPAPAARSENPPAPPHAPGAGRPAASPDARRLPSASSLSG